MAIRDALHSLHLIEANQRLKQVGTEVTCGIILHPTCEQVRHWRCEARRRPPNKLLLFFKLPLLSVLVVQTAKEKAVVPHLRKRRRVCC